MNSLYIHIPFCAKKCAYCDFVSFRGKEAFWETYIDSLIQEFRDKQEYFKIDKIGTVFIGGGTPSLLPAKLIEGVMKEIQPFLIDGAEVTIETNPGTLTEEKLRIYKKCGINRISMGVQSFNPKLLKTIGRIHGLAEIHDSYEMARDAGFNNINLDLIFALPGQTIEDWEKDLHSALALAPEHISAYSLIVEVGTPLAQNLDQFPKLPSEEDELSMYELAISALKAAGYHHYEISNFAKPGFECKHNIVYWQNGNYLGLGVAAHSHLDGRRFANPNCLDEYQASIKAHKSFCYEFSPQHARAEKVITGLRLLDGIKLSKDDQDFYEEEIEGLINAGLLSRKDSIIRMTAKGLPIANEIFREFV